MKVAIADEYMMKRYVWRTFTVRETTIPKEASKKA